MTGSNAFEYQKDIIMQFIVYLYDIFLLCSAFACMAGFPLPERFVLA